MWNNKALVVGFFVVCGLLMTGCGGDHSDNHSDNHADETVGYQCPMKCEGDKFYPAAGACPVCSMDLAVVDGTATERIVEDGRFSDMSIFNLASTWTTQDGEAIKLGDLRGNVLVVVMIYTSCQAACPRLVADVRSIHAAVQDESVHYVFVSIDPETDTPERLKEFAIANEMDGPQWTFLRGTLDDVREFSNVLAVKYRRISPIDFSHSNIISVFDQVGTLQFQQEGLGVDNAGVVAKIKELER